MDPNEKPPGHPEGLCTFRDQLSALFVITHSLYVRKGDQGFLLLITSPLVDHAGDSGIAIATTLAAKILARM